MKVAFVLAMLLVSSSALFMNSRPPQGMPGPVSNGGPPGPNGGQSMPDMGLVMSMVRQILMIMLPKLVANPSLISTIVGGGKGSGKPGPAPPRPVLAGVPPPMMGGNSGPMGGNSRPGMGGNPSPMGGGGGPFGGMNPMNIFNPPASAGARPTVPLMGGPGFVPTSSDKMKDMRLLVLLQDPSVGLGRDPYIRQYIPRGGQLPYYGWSLPDIAKDQIIFSIQRMASRRGGYTPKEREIVHLIGDPVEMGIAFGAGANMRPV